MCGILLVAELLEDAQCEPSYPSEASCCDTRPAAAAAASSVAPPDSCCAAAAAAAAFLPGLSRRGPDAVGACNVLITGTRCHLTLGASLLQLRGTERLAVPPPLLSPDSGAILCFNGEIFSGLDIEHGENDGAQLLESLETTAATDIPGLLSRLRGPWALLYYRPLEQRLWFGRDWLGRRSLLVQTPSSDTPSFVLSSTVPLTQVNDTNSSSTHISSTNSASSSSSAAADAVAAALAAAANWTELEPGLYSISGADLAQQLMAAKSGAGAVAWPWSCVQRHPWESTELNHLIEYERTPVMTHPSSDTHLLSAGGDAAAQQLRAAAERVLEALRAAVAVRCSAIDGCAAPIQDASASCSLEEAGGGKLVAGASSQHRLPWEAPAAPPLLPPAPVMILFSGGADSTLLAALTSEALPPGAPIDLVSICFDNGASPDRAGARDALLELSDLAPDRPWRLIEANCSLADADAARAHLLSLLAPAGTVMDLNIGAALWLAARGEGRVVTPQEVAAAKAEAAAGSKDQRGTPATKSPQTPSADVSSSSGNVCTYRSCARVAFTGHGADEQAAGYGRHRTCHRNGGWDALGRELASDVARLWIRNLGRDDRLIADRGREARHPFLDEGVVGALLEVPLWLLFDPGLPLGQGDKAVLREVLRLVGLPRAAARVKRALQFGSRIAKHANVRDFGSGQRANASNAGSVPLAQLLSSSS